MKKVGLGVLPLLLFGCGGSDDPQDGIVFPDGDGTSLSSCYNPTLNELGTETITNISKKAGLAQPVNVQEREVVQAVVDYEGQSGVLEVRLYDDTPDNRTYVVVDESSQAVTTLGQFFEGEMITYKPSGLAYFFDLASGESRTQPTITVYTDGVETGTMDVKMKYEKRETVTVPAGTFETCLVTLEIMLVDDGQESTALFKTNFGIGNGIAIRDELTASSNGTTLTTVDELISGTINGEPIQ
ncbi:hypothetical protein [Grimontia marina]|uniref:Lipoprotein n=1 Tax=Grimontia marina TaxID=646534 RepID=A0A128F2Z4_9GAMM|nr:hypothetical protein [Grimontia marina]CZF81178.1 hypothetical protein GMA8713_01742 [Grimontia marina]